MPVNGPVIVAFAALGGSLVGACSSIAATFMGQRLQARWARLRVELEEREKLYGIFVEEAVHLFVDSIRQSAIDPAKFMRLYSKVARIRLTSSDRVLRAAEEVGRRLLEAYERPPENPAEVLARYANGEGRSGGRMESGRLLALRRAEDDHGFGKAGRLRRFNLHHFPGEVLVPAEHMLEKCVEGGFAGERSLRVGGCASSGLGGRLQRDRGRLLRGGAETGQGQSGGHQYDSATVHGSFLLSKTNVQT